MSKRFYLLYPENSTKAVHVELSDEEAQKLIPKGDYCYDGKRENPCPFWDSFGSLPEQSCGFCHYLKTGDFTENGTMLLWDQLKECGVNID